MRLFRRLIPDNCYSVVNAQRDTKAIEAGAKIRGARRNANGNVLHSDTECSDGQRQRQPIGYITANWKYVPIFRLAKK